MKTLFVFLTFFLPISLLAQPNTILDIEGNNYNIIKIGDHYWTAENLKTTTLNDGTPINNITDDNTWISNSLPAYSYYNNNSDLKNDYGILYNYYAIETNKLCPDGWKVPSVNDWNYLINKFYGPQTAAHYLKHESFTSPFILVLENKPPSNKQPDKFHTIEIKTSQLGNPLFYALNTFHDITPKITIFNRSDFNSYKPHPYGSSNLSNFTALAGGLRTKNFKYNIGSDAGFWHTSFLTDNDSIILKSMFHNSDVVFTKYGQKYYGASVRCIKQ